jgi:hypothetical protein
MMSLSIGRSNQENAHNAEKSENSENPGGGHLNIARINDTSDRAKTIALTLWTR